jgi:hypothetical protein
VSNNNNYIITTLDSGSQEYTNLCGNQIRAPFSLAAPSAQNLRFTGAPYVVSQNDKTLFGQTIIPPDVDPFYTPFSYYNFETSGSQYVTNVQGANIYTGSFASQDGDDPFVTPVYTNSSPFFGTYSMEFDASDGSGVVSLGTPNERGSWNTLFSGSFSVSMWFKPNRAGAPGFQNNNNINNTLFGLQQMGTDGLGDSNGGGFGFELGRAGFGECFVIRSTQLASYNGWSGNGTIGGGTTYNNQAWNHAVFIISGASDATYTGTEGREIRCFINNNNLGLLSAVNAAYKFQRQWNPSYSVTFGPSLDARAFDGEMDEVSIWDFALDSDQVSLLYNGGSGISNMNLLPSGSAC